MFTEVTLKIFSDCCICFALLGSCPTVIPYSYPLVLPALICALAAGLSSYLSEKIFTPWYRLCAVLPLFTLLLAKSYLEMLVLIPVILYTAAVILRGSLILEYFSFRHYFKRSLVLLVVVWALVSLANYMEDPTGVAEMVVQPANILRYGIVHFMCGVALQRQLRLGSQNDSRSQLVATLGSTGVILFGFAAAEPLFREGAAKLLRMAFTVVLFPVSAVVEFITYLIMRAVENLQSDERYQEALQNSEAINPGGYTEYQELYQSIMENRQEGTPQQFAIVFLILGTIIAVVLMFFVFGRLRSKEIVMLSEDTVAVPRRSIPHLRLSPRARVRQTYRDFLKLEKRRGTKIRKDCTTAEILQKLSAGTNKTAATDLREIYIRARYDETREVSRQQAEAARTALRLIYEKRS